MIKADSYLKRAVASNQYYSQQQPRTPSQNTISSTNDENLRRSRKKRTLSSYLESETIQQQQFHTASSPPPQSEIQKVNYVEKGIESIGTAIPLKYHNITTLYLSNNSIDDLRGIEVFIKLKILSLANNNLDTFTQLDPIKNLKSLQILNLEFNKVTYLPYYRLHVLFRCPQLRLLDNKEITARERDSMEATLKKEAISIDLMFQNEATAAKLEALLQKMETVDDVPEPVVQYLRGFKTEKTSQMQPKQKFDITSVFNVWNIDGIIEEKDRDRVCHELRREVYRLTNIKRVSNKQRDITFKEEDSLELSYSEILMVQQTKIANLFFEVEQKLEFLIEKLFTFDPVQTLTQLKKLKQTTDSSQLEIQKVANEFKQSITNLISDFKEECSDLQKTVNSCEKAANVIEKISTTNTISPPTASLNQEPVIIQPHATQNEELSSSLKKPPVTVAEPKKSKMNSKEVENLKKEIEDLKKENQQMTKRKEESMLQRLSVQMKQKLDSYQKQNEKLNQETATLVAAEIQKLKTELAEKEEQILKHEQAITAAKDHSPKVEKHSEQHLKTEKQKIYSKRDYDKLCTRFKEHRRLRKSVFYFTRWKFFTLQATCSSTFYRRIIYEKYLFIWCKKVKRKQLLNHQRDRALLLPRYFGKWRKAYYNRYEENLRILDLEKQTTYFYPYILKKRMFIRWCKWMKNEVYMAKHLLQEFTTRRTSQLLKNIIIIWNSKAKQRLRLKRCITKTEKFYRENMLSKVLSHWIMYYKMKKERKVALSTISNQIILDKKAVIFSIWYHKSMTQKRFDNHNLLALEHWLFCMYRKAFDAWKRFIKQKQNKLKYVLYKQRKLRKETFEKCFRFWKSMTKKIKQLKEEYTWALNHFHLFKVKRYFSKWSRRYSTRITDRLKVLRKEYSTTRLSITKQDDKLSKLEVENLNLIHRLHEISKDFSEAKVLLTESENKLKKYDRVETEREILKTSLRSENETLKVQLTDCHREISKLKNQFSEVKSESLSDLLLQIKGYQSNVALLEKELHIKEKELILSNENVARLEETTKELQMKLLNLTTVNTSLRSELDSRKQEFLTVEKSLFSSPALHTDEMITNQEKDLMIKKSNLRAKQLHLEKEQQAFEMKKQSLF